MFLGFEIQMRSLKRLNDYYRSKKLEAYNRHKNIVLRKGAQEYERFLKMIE